MCFRNLKRGGFDETYPVTLKRLDAAPALERRILVMRDPREGFNSHILMVLSKLPLTSWWAFGENLTLYIDAARVALETM
jgi:hypothetical protein